MSCWICRANPERRAGRWAGKGLALPNRRGEQRIVAGLARDQNHGVMLPVAGFPRLDADDVAELDDSRSREAEPGHAVADVAQLLVAAVEGDVNLLGDKAENEPDQQQQARTQNGEPSIEGGFSSRSEVQNFQKDEDERRPGIADNHTFNKR